MRSFFSENKTKNFCEPLKSSQVGEKKTEKRKKEELGIELKVE